MTSINSSSISTLNSIKSDKLNNPKVTQQSVDMPKSLPVEVSTLNSLQSDKLNNPKVTQQSVDMSKSLPAESTQVTISDEGKALINALSETDEGKALLHALSEIDGTSPTENPEELNNLTSFAYGALGIDNPEQVAEAEKDSSYTAGQYLKGALTVGSIFLAIV
jgi:hypothetical protein